MDFENTFPLRYYINLGRREDRRTELEFRLDQIGVTAQRFPAIDSRFCRNPRGYENKGRYALALSIRLAIRKAKQQKAPALLLLEDDAILHPNFRELISRINLPDDWGIFYLGCQHTTRPIPHSDGLVKVTRALDSHAAKSRSKCGEDLDFVVSASQGLLYAEAAIDHSALFRWDFA